MDDKPKRPPRKKPAAKRPARKAAAPEDAARQGPAPEEPAAAAPEAAAAPPGDVPAAITTPADEPATAGAAADEPTAVIPPVEEPTAVIPADAEATTLMPPAAPGAAPPAASAPIGYAPLSRTAVVAPPRDTRPVLLIVVAAAVVAIAAIALMWVLLSGGDADAFMGTWARTPAVGGGVIVEKDDDGVMVTWFDGQLGQQGPLPASLDGDVLSFQIPDVDGQTVDATLTTTANADELQLSLAGATESLTKAETLAPASGTSPAPTVAPTAAPSASPSPSASVSLSPSPTPSGTASPSPSPSASGSDQAVVNAILALQAGVLQYAGTHGNVFPSPTDVSQTGAVGQSMQVWPANPYTGQAMKAGASPGDYAYEQLQEGHSYRITGYLNGGRTFLVP